VCKEAKLKCEEPPLIGLRPFWRINIVVVVVDDVLLTTLQTDNLLNELWASGLTFDMQRSVIVCDFERDPPSSFCVVKSAQLRDIVLASLVDVDVARCTQTHPWLVSYLVNQLTKKPEEQSLSSITGNQARWRSNRACKACSARGPIAVGVQTNPVWGRGEALTESLHTGLLQPCYATDLDGKLRPEQKIS